MTEEETIRKEIEDMSCTRTHSQESSHRPDASPALRNSVGHSGNVLRTPEDVARQNLQCEKLMATESNDCRDVQNHLNSLFPGLFLPKNRRERVMKAHSLIDKVYRWENLVAAWKQVKRKRGAYGIDKVSISEFNSQWEMHLRAIQRQLMENRFIPKPVKRIWIPKDSSGKNFRPVGIPVVRDRVVQAALARILNPIFEKEFSNRSFGFRANRSAHDAIATLINDRKEKYKVVLDADIQSFFDEIDHHVAMTLICTKVADGKVLNLLEAFLKNGISYQGAISIPNEGTPQGGVISPLISNIVLNVLDKAIEFFNWRFVRYADDFVVLTKTEEDAKRAHTVVKFILEKLKLRLSETKTKLTNFQAGFDFLGFRLKRSLVGIRQKSQEKFKDRIRQLTRRQQGNNLKTVIKKINPVIRGWSNYFGKAHVKSLMEKLNSWIRMRLRSFKFKRKCRNDNWRIKNKKLFKWGLISLQTHPNTATHFS